MPAILFLCHLLITPHHSNTADNRGGAIFSMNSNLTISGSTRIVGNRATDGGGIYFTGDDVISINFGLNAVIITGNTPNNVICLDVRLVV